MNPGLPAAAYDDAIRRIVTVSTMQTLAATNREKYELIKDGVQGTFRNARGERVCERLRVFDFEVPENNHFLCVRELWVRGLAGEIGRYRSCGVGIFRGERLVHMAPPADRVPKLMADLLNWLENAGEHPLIASCVFHYEFERIHPFADGNGRMGRLWQTLILRNWRPLLAHLPVETLIRERQEGYYRVLAVADEQADATPFIEFMLSALCDAIREAVAVDQASDQVPDQVAALMRLIGTSEQGSNDLMQALGLSHRPTFRENYLNPALEDEWIERTHPIPREARPSGTG